MEKRVIFKGWWLPALLVAPQLIISFLFFFYPSGQALWNSLFLPDPFGLKTEFVGLDNFKFLLTDPYYLESFKTTIFSLQPFLFFQWQLDYILQLWQID